MRCLAVGNEERIRYKDNTHRKPDQEQRFVSLMYFNLGVVNVERVRVSVAVGVDDSIPTHERVERVHDGVHFCLTTVGRSEHERNVTHRFDDVVRVGNAWHDVHTTSRFDWDKHE